MNSSAAWQSARAVLLFFPVPSEPDIAPLLADALAAGKLLALPRFNAATQAYEAVRVLDPARELADGPFKLREPVAECPVVPMNRLDLALVPGVGFTPTGHRLGRGKGYFDRLLPAVAGLTCGVAFDCQLVDTLPVEPHDAVLNAVAKLENFGSVAELMTLLRA